MWKRPNIGIAKEVANVEDLYGFDVADLHNHHILQILTDIIFMGYSLWGGFCPFCGVILHSWSESAKWWQLHYTIVLTTFVFPACLSFFQVTLVILPNVALHPSLSFGSMNMGIRYFQKGKAPVKLRLEGILILWSSKGREIHMKHHKPVNSETRAAYFEVCSFGRWKS